MVWRVGRAPRGSAASPCRVWGVLVVILAAVPHPVESEDLTVFCGYDWGSNATGLPLNIEMTWTWRMASTCGSPDMQQFRQRYPALGLHTTFVQHSTLLLENFALGFNSVQLDFYMELLAKGSTVLELLRSDSHWVDVLADEVEDLSLYGVDTSEIAPHWRKVDRRNRTVGIVIEPSRQVMYYRQDLFEKYGYSFPNSSWGQFERVVMDVMQRERAERGHDDFWGFCISSRRDANDITINLISFLSGFEGAGTIVEDDGRVSINNAAAARMIDMWAAWLNPASGKHLMPRECLKHDAVGAHNMLMDDRALVAVSWTMWWSGVMRDWNRRSHPMQIAAGPFPGKGGAGVAGDWSFMMSRHTRNKHLAAQWLKILARNGKYVALESPGIEPIGTMTRSDPESWRRYCELHPILCQSIEKYPAFWGRLRHRPTRVTGGLYPLVTHAVYKHVYAAFAGKPGLDAVRDIESDVKLLLGHVQHEGGEAPEIVQRSRIGVYIAAAVSAAVFVGIAVVVRRGWSKMRHSCPSCPVSALASCLVFATFVAVLLPFIANTRHTTQDISSRLSLSIRVQSLRMVQRSLQGTLESLTESAESFVKEIVVAKMKTNLRSMEVHPRMLVVMLDRMGQHEVVVSSDMRRQPERVLLSQAHTSQEVHPWLSAFTESAPGWWAGGRDAADTLVMKVSGETIHVNYIGVSSGWERDPRFVSYLLVYFTPEQVFLEKPQAAVRKSFNIAVIISLVAAACTAACAVAGSQALVHLAGDMEAVGLLELDDPHQRRSRITELASLLLGFHAMCSMLQEYKAYLPKTVLVESDAEEDDAGEEDFYNSSHSSHSSRSSQLTSLSSHSEHEVRTPSSGVAARRGFGLSCEMRQKRGLCMSFKVAEEHEVLGRAAQPQDVVAEILSVVEQAVGQVRGILHPFRVSSPTAILVSWGVVTPDSAYHSCSSGSH